MGDQNKRVFRAKTAGRELLLLRTGSRNIPTGWIMPPWEDPPMRLHQRLVSIFGGIRKAVATYLDEQAINAACREEKYTWRERLFNPTNAVHLFILQILNRNTALNDLPARVTNPSPVRPSARRDSDFPCGFSNACSAAWPKHSCPIPAGSGSTRRAAGVATEPSSWTARAAPCPIPPSCNGTSVSQATSVRAAVSQWPTC